MNIDYLHYYLDVAQTKSITRAAKLNFISPQGMSRAMNELEKELGCELLIRYSNKLELSPVGKELIPRVEDIVERYAETLNFATSHAHDKQTGEHSIHLECQNVAMLAFFPQKAKDHIFETPGINFRELPNSQIRQLLLANAASDSKPPYSTIGLIAFFNQERDLGSSGIADLEKKGYLYRPYLKSYDKVIVGANSPLAAKSILTEEDILSRPIVSTSTQLYDTLARRFGRDSISLASTDFSQRKRLVERDAAISFLPAFASLTMTDEKGFVLRDMEKPYEVEIGFIGMEEDFESEHFRALVDILNAFYVEHEDSELYALFK